MAGGWVGSWQVVSRPPHALGSQRRTERGLGQHACWCTGAYVHVCMWWCVWGGGQQCGSQQRHDMPPLDGSLGAAGRGEGGIASPTPTPRVWPCSGCVCGKLLERRPQTRTARVSHRSAGVSNVVLMPAAAAFVVVWRRCRVRRLKDNNPCF